MEGRRREDVGFRHAARRPADRVTRGADEDRDHLLRRLKLPPRGLQAGGRDRGGDRYRARAHRRRERDLRRHRRWRADLLQARSGEVSRGRGDPRSAPQVAPLSHHPSPAVRRPSRSSSVRSCSGVLRAGSSTDPVGQMAQRLSDDAAGAAPEHLHHVLPGDGEVEAAQRQGARPPDARDGGLDGAQLLEFGRGRFGVTSRWRAPSPAA